MASVKVAVRVRPFNKREIKLNSKSIVEVLDVHRIQIHSNSENVYRPHGFTFDLSISETSTQGEVYRDLGTHVIDDAFRGYNVCVFAYGQTGSGKTHTMMGHESDPGLIPRICKTMFERMRDDSAKTTYRTHVSYLEIYNERVKDLLSGDDSHNLRVREHPKSGPYVQSLSSCLVLHYEDLFALMSKGNRNRTTASTNMNDTSSRSHAIFTITFVQAFVKEDGMPSETVSKIHLVDLAGSERADATGATDKRLKEGAHINKSLVTLGSVISALAKSSSNKNKTFVPYRDSVLTWLLKDSLGGNSKTIMIATVSPADVNYGETLSTLHYANRAKNIINQPTVNEDPNVKLIRELREEIERLRQSMMKDPSKPILETVSELAIKEAQERCLTEEWNEKWNEAANILQEQRALALKRTGLGVVLDSEQPHLVGIDEDVMSTGIILYTLQLGDTIIGSDETSVDIVLKGPSIKEKHCVIELRHNIATLIPQNDALCLVNAIEVNSPYKLTQGCVLVLGKTNIFRYNDPLEVATMKQMNTSLHQSLLLSESLSDIRSAALLMRQEDGEESSPMAVSNVSSSNDSSVEYEENEEDDTENNNNNAHHQYELTKIYENILSQKENIMKCLENDQIEVSVLHVEISRLQHLQSAYSKLEIERMKRQYWSSSKTSKNTNAEDYDEKFSLLVEQEVDRRLFQEKMMKANSEFHEKEIVQLEREKEIHCLRRQHELEIYHLKKKLFGSSGIVLTSSSCPVLVSIPSYRLIDSESSPSSSYIEYEVHVIVYKSLSLLSSRENVEENAVESWNFFRRFRRFRDLHVNQCRIYGSQISGLSFPSRRIFGSLSTEVSLGRQKALQSYLNKLIQTASNISSCPLHVMSDKKSAVLQFSSFFKSDEAS